MPRTPDLSARPDTRNLHPAYRPDIDGLRGVAILAVVGFHISARVPGGFVGVDIFFVISGFLISSILFRSLAQGDGFSFAEFYARRIRRLFPALIVVLAAVYAFAWTALLPVEFEQLGKHMAASAAFVLNIALQREAGYFDLGAELKPLMHLWSLAVEEQFYLVYPLIIWGAWRSRLNIWLVVAALGGLSFVLNIAAINDDAATAFFLLQARFWELLTGAALAAAAVFRGEGWLRGKLAGVLAPASRDRVGGLVLSAVGLLLIAVAILRLDRSDPFPGWWALLPVAGASLLILAGPDAWINRTLLANRAMVFLGLISYPLYLWHWPLLSFARIVESEAPGRELRGAAVAVSLLLAWLTYRWIEKPFRSGGRTALKTAALAAALFAIGGLGLLTYAGNGLPWRKAASPELIHQGDVGHEQFHVLLQRISHPCAPPSLAERMSAARDFVRCAQSRNDIEPDIALIGDSHAEHLFPGLVEQLAGHNLALYARSQAPFLRGGSAPAVYAHVLSSASIKTVIVTMNWVGRSGEVPASSTLERELTEVAEALLASGKRVYFTDDLPAFSFDPNKCRLARPYATKQHCSVERWMVDGETMPHRQVLHDLARKDPRIRIIETLRYFCDDVRCEMARGGRLFFRDSWHLNINGSREVGARIVRDYPELTAR